MKDESSDILTKSEGSSVKRGEVFLTKQSCYKPGFVWHTKENNATDLRVSASNKGTYELVLEEESVPVKAKTASVKPITNIDFAILRQRELISLTKFTNNQDEDLLYFSSGPYKQYKQTINEVQDKYDDSLKANQQWHHHTTLSWNASS